MKILQIMFFDTGACGPTSVIKPIITRLNKMGHTIGVFSPYNYSNHKKELCESIGAAYYGTNGERLFTRKKLRTFIRDFDEYEIFHLHGIFEIKNVLLAYHLKKIGRPYILSLHGNLMSEALKKNRIIKKVYIFLFVKFMVSNAKCIHVLTEEELGDLRKIEQRFKYKLIYNGADNHVPIKKYEKVSSPLKILFIGRIDIHCKGIDILFQALIQDVKFSFENIRLYIVGPYESKQDEIYILNMMKRYPILNQIVSIEGPKYGDEKEKYYEKCDLFIHTSRNEGMPVAVLEAMARGMACAVTIGTNMVNILKKSSGGIVLPDDPKEMAKALKMVVTNKDIIPEMGKAAYEWSIDNLSWDKIYYQYEDMYFSST